MPAVARAGEPTADTGSSAPGMVAPQVRAPATEDLRHWEIRLGAGVGAARMVVLGQTHGGIGATIPLHAVRWWNRIGAGLHVTELIAEPWSTVKSDRGRPVFRDLGWEIEPELAVRRSRVVTAWLTIGWRANVSAGVVLARTMEDCASLFSHHGCLNTLERSTELGAAAGAGVFTHVGPVALDVGTEMQADSAADGALVLEASAGAVW